MLLHACNTRGSRFDSRFRLKCFLKYCVIGYIFIYFFNFNDIFTFIWKKSIHMHFWRRLLFLKPIEVLYFSFDKWKCHVTFSPDFSVLYRKRECTKGTVHWHLSLSFMFCLELVTLHQVCLPYEPETLLTLCKHSTLKVTECTKMM